ncbi:MAG: Holliday junction resolvase Hjc [Sulfolobaceae archaeon]|nr:Holliday junction resolvase Hjc [Sulfolobaceae archaeon]
MSENKRRGASVERRLVSRLRERGFAVIRAPASGSKRKDSIPDIVAMKSGVILAIEVKSRNGGKKIYIRKEQLDGIKDFSKRAGAEPFIAVKLGENREVLFVNLSEVKQTSSGNYVLDMESVSNYMTLDDLIRYVESKISKTLDSFM